MVSSQRSQGGGDAALRNCQKFRKLAAQSTAKKIFELQTPQQTNAVSYPCTKLAGREPLPTNRDECQRFRTAFRTMHV